MVGKKKKKTKSQERRFRAIKEIGCLACRQLGYYDVPGEAHHLLNGYRRGDEYSVSLCQYHHRNVTELDKETAYRILGPSLATNKKEFIERFGTDEELLSTQNKLIEEWEQSIV